MEQIKEELPKPILIEDLGTMFTTENSKRKRRYGLYKCGFCGNEFKAQVQHINSGGTKSCGCQKDNSDKIIDITGKRFGRLQVLERTNQRKGKSIVWKCRCDCKTRWWSKGL